MTKKRVTIDGREVEVSVTAAGRVAQAGEAVVELVEIREGDAVVLVNGQPRLVPFVRDRDQLELHWNGERRVAEVADAGSSRRKSAREHSTAAPMPGVILKILVETGASVSAGDPVLVLEAMKMEHQIRAPRDGVVSAIRCSVGDLVQPGVELVEIGDAPR